VDLAGVCRNQPVVSFEQGIERAREDVIFEAGNQYDLRNIIAHGQEVPKQPPGKT
jgi:hypothetical protein